jgi:hypothetical protein
MFCVPRYSTVVDLKEFTFSLVFLIAFVGIFTTVGCVIAAF